MKKFFKFGTKVKIEIIIKIMPEIALILPKCGEIFVRRNLAREMKNAAPKNGKKNPKT